MVLLVHLGHLHSRRKTMTNDVTFEDLVNQIRKLETNLQVHLIDLEPHAEVSPEVPGLVPRWVSNTLYTGGMRYRGLDKKDVGTYKLATMSFGQYIGWGTNFSDFPTEFTKSKENLVKVTIEGFGDIVDKPSAENSYGSDAISDSGVYRHIDILDINLGEHYETYMGSVYSTSKNYGWFSSTHWEDGVVSIGNGEIKVRRQFDGASLTLDIKIAVDGLGITGQSGITKVGSLPKGYQISSVTSSNNRYFTAVGQTTSDPTATFPISVYINNSGKDFQVVADRKIDRLFFSTSLNSSDPSE